MEEGQKLAMTAFEDARAGMLALMPKKIDKDGYKSNMGKVEKSAEALKTFGKDHTADVWSKIMNPSFDAFVKAAKEAEPKISRQGHGGRGALERRERVLLARPKRATARSQRSLVNKGQAAGSAAPGMPAPAENPRE